MAAEIESRIREILMNKTEATPVAEEKVPVEIPIAAAPKVTAASAKAKIDISVDD